MQELPLLALSVLRDQVVEVEPVADQVVLRQMAISMPMAALAVTETHYREAAMVARVHEPGMVAMVAIQQAAALAGTMRQALPLGQRPHQKRLAS